MKIPARSVEQTGRLSIRWIVRWTEDIHNPASEVRADASVRVIFHLPKVHRRNVLPTPRWINFGCGFVLQR